MKAIILAGEGEQDIKYFGQGKALINFKGKPLIEYTIDALTQSEMIEYILVVGNKALLTPYIGNKVDEIIDQEKNMLDNLMKGISYFEENEKILISTCDIPLITFQAVQDFIIKSLNLNADLCYPIIERSICEGNYPDAKRTYASLKEGDFTGGNLIMVNPFKVKSIEDHIRLLIKHRKNPLKMTRALGPKIVLQMLSKRLTIEKLEIYIKERFNIEGRALITPYPEVGSDIDRIEDIEILEKYI
ncbi:nucleotidyltransferase family protein [Alkaliphilus sp. MSJ-5]|uniref:Nucleotidyltransferase family protein n=1 Tax=Alkaliphilus flagellatus TaxID=2841507 RepID=A0ABS6G0R9_9FIRM|nr:nucleotidyltransferase family protein [Alkaliphilus flagellatus]MBU5676090.1 nucleotidyltransferase family protein [Alkaliphilus flagellatus]